jgi:hypothetical protein
VGESEIGTAEPSVYPQCAKAASIASIASIKSMLETNKAKIARPGA